MKLLIGESGDKPIFHDFEKNPILFISGDTGSGKSNLEHYLIQQVIKDEKFDRIKLLLVDCKRIEFGYYVKLGNLVGERIFLGTDAFDPYSEADWTTLCNKLNSDREAEGIFAVIDEYSDIICAIPDTIETFFEKVRDKGYPFPFYLVVSTSSPRTDVLTEKISKLCDARICFNSNDGSVSRAVLGDKKFATNLEVGNGYYGEFTKMNYTRISVPYVEI